MRFIHTFLSFIIRLALVACTGKRRNAPQKPPLSAIVSWQDSVIRLGKIRMGDSIVFHFRFRIEEKESLILEKAESSCSCTELSFYPAPLHPVMRVC